MTLLQIIETSGDLAEIQAQVIAATDIDKERALSYAVRHGKEDIVRLLLQYDAYPDALTATDSTSMREQDQYSSGGTLGLGSALSARERVLHMAAYGARQRALHMAPYHPFLVRNVAIIKWLLLAGANIRRSTLVVNPTGADRQYRLTNIVLEAARYEDVEMFELILAYAGNQLSLADTNKLKALQKLRAPTPSRLYTYVTAGDLNGLEMYVRNASQYEKDKALAYAVSASQYEDKALAYAASARREDMVRILVDNGAYPNTAQLPFFYDYPSLAYYDDNPNKDNDYFQHNQVGRVLHVAYEHRDLPIIALLLDAKANLHYWYKLGDQTIVMHAVTKSDREMLDLFLTHGWKVDDIGGLLNDGGETALNVACSNDLNDMIEYLIEKGANVDLQSGNVPDKTTNIHLCIHAGNRQGVRLLMQSRVDINVLDEYKETALSSAIRSYMHCRHRLGIADDDAYEDPLDPFDDQDDDNEMKRRRGIIKDILEYNVDFDYQDTRRVLEDEWKGSAYRTISDLVGDYRRKQQVEYLHTLTAHRPIPPDPLPPNYTPPPLPPNHIDFQDVMRGWGKTALHRAVENAQFDAVKTLLEKGARVDILDVWGRDVNQVASARYQHERDSADYAGPDSDASYRWWEVDQVAAEKIPIYLKIGKLLSTRRFIDTKITPHKFPEHESDNILNSFMGFLFG
jgi:ankyrin repeat protein